MMPMSRTEAELRAVLAYPAQPARCGPASAQRYSALMLPHVEASVGSAMNSTVIADRFTL